jgi:hypothetical protein
VADLPVTLPIQSNQPLEKFGSTTIVQTVTPNRIVGVVCCTGSTFTSSKGKTDDQKVGALPHVETGIFNEFIEFTTPSALSSPIPSLGIELVYYDEDSINAQLPFKYVLADDQNVRKATNACRVFHNEEQPS